METSLLDIAGAFHLSLAGGIILVIIAFAILQLRSERFRCDNALLLLGVGTYIWGSAASHWGATTFHVSRSHGGGFDPSMTEHNLATIAAIEAIYSTVAALAVVLSIILTLARKRERN